jgi:hypothetical protein
MHLVLIALCFWPVWLGVNGCCSELSTAACCAAQGAGNGLYFQRVAFLIVFSVRSLAQLKVSTFVQTVIATAAQRRQRNEANAVLAW